MQKEHTIKPEQDSKVEKTTLTAALDNRCQKTNKTAKVKQIPRLSL